MFYLDPHSRIVGLIETKNHTSCTTTSCGLEQTIKMKFLCLHGAIGNIDVSDIATRLDFGSD